MQHSHELVDQLLRLYHKKHLGDQHLNLNQ